VPDLRTSKTRRQTYLWFQKGS